MQEETENIEERDIETNAQENMQYAKTVKQLVELVNANKLRLPEFQREFVWTPKKVKEFLDSLYRDYPTGVITVLSPSYWKGRTRSIEGGRLQSNGPSDTETMLILDGQQRITSLVNIYNREVNFGSYFFHPDTQAIQLGGNKTQGAPWINIGDLWNKGPSAYLIDRYLEEDNAEMRKNRIEAVYNILNRKILFQQINHRKLPDIVSMFERLNRTGVRVKREELALANLERLWEGSRERTHRLLDSLPNDFSDLGIGFAIKCLSCVAVNRTNVETLSRKLETPDGQDDVRNAWESVEYSIPRIIDFIRDFAGFDSYHWLQSTNAVVPMVFAMAKNRSSFAAESSQKKWISWFYGVILSGHYSGSSDTVLNSEFAELIQKEKQGVEFVDTLKSLLSTDNNARTEVTSEELPSRADPSKELSILYGMTRLNHGVDWGTGIPVKSNSVGRNLQFEVHHIFARKLLQATSFNEMSNDIGNLAFIVKKSNLSISTEPPADYFPRLLSQDKTALKSQFVPEDSDLWAIDKYPAFIAKRRQLIAENMTSLLKSGRLC